MVHIRLALIAGLALVASGLLQPATAAADVTNGRIAFMRFDVAAQDFHVFTINPDGTGERQLLSDFAGLPHWSPDGARIVLCCDLVRIVTVDTGAVQTLPIPAGLDHIDCLAWTPDGSRLICNGFGGEADPGLDGIYSIRASDGGDIRLITPNPGGDPVPFDLPPDGAQLVFVRANDRDALFIVPIGGGTVRRIEIGELLDVISVSWSPDGTSIVFSARKAPNDRRSLFLIRPDGTGLREIPVTPACGGSRDDRSSRGCLDPTWSPDGTKILFDIFPGTNFQKYLYTIDLDGSHLHRVTRHGFVQGDDEGEQWPDWGVHPLQ